MKNILFVAVLASAICSRADALHRIFNWAERTITNWAERTISNWVNWAERTTTDWVERTIAQMDLESETTNPMRYMYTLEGVSPHTFYVLQRYGVLCVRTPRMLSISSTLTLPGSHFDDMPLYTQLILSGYDSPDEIVNALRTAFRKNVIVQNLQQQISIDHES